MPRPRPLIGGEAARQTLAHRLTRTADRLRQFNTRFGIRSRRLWMVWTQWSGGVRGEGVEYEMARVEVLPTPKLSEASAINSRPLSHGVMPEGSLRADQISAGAYTADMLLGRVIPGMGNEPPRVLRRSSVDPLARPSLPDDVDFYFEVVEDQRGDVPPERLRFRPTGKPWRNEGGLYWALNLEAADQGLERDGSTQSDDVDIVG